MPANRRLPALGGVGGIAIGVLLGLGLVLVGGCAGKAQPSNMATPSDAAAPPPSSQSARGGGGEMAEMVDRDGDDRDAGGVGGAGDGGGELSLAVYERLLVEQELRLRSAGVAMRGDLANTVEDADTLAKSEGDGTKKTKKPKKLKSKSPTATKDSGGDLAYSSKTGTGRASASAPTEDQSVSQRICELAVSTCDLERQICGLAARHPDEERYAQVCQRAGEDCQLARDACEARRV